MRSKSVLHYLANRNIEWRFIPERAAWLGSVYARMVGSVKKCLRKVIGRSFIRYDKVNTLLVEVEGIFNRTIHSKSNRGFESSFPAHAA